MHKSSNNPESQLHRVRGVLHSLVNHEIVHTHARVALQFVDPVLMYSYLYATAEQYNPYHRKDPKWRKRCMIEAFSRNPRSIPQSVYRCKIAALFYLLSEGLYSQPALPEI